MGLDARPGHRRRDNPRARRSCAVSSACRLLRLGSRTQTQPRIPPPARTEHAERERGPPGAAATHVSLAVRQVGSSWIFVAGGRR